MKVWTGERKYRVKPQYNICFEIAKQYSGMGEFRMFQLWHMMGQAAKLPEGEVLEVGCGFGGSGLMISFSARAHGVKEMIHLCDTFRGLVKADPAIDKLKDGEMAGGDPSQIAEMMARYGIGDVTILGITFPDERQEHWEGRKFRFAHIDVDLYRSMKDAFEFIWPRMVPGGIVVLDDYGEQDCPGVGQFVDEVCDLPDSTWLMHGGLQAIAVKR